MTHKPHFDHVGLVVPDLDAAVAWLGQALGLVVRLREPLTELDGELLRLPTERVHLRGALMGTDDETAVELHEFSRPESDPGFTRSAHDLGFGHFAWRTSDIRNEMERLADLGVRWTAPTPNHITTGPYAGRSWIYGWVPELSAVLELLEDTAAGQ